MRGKITMRTMLSALCAVVLAWPVTAVAQDDLDQEELKKIDAAIPQEAPAKPKEARKLLIWTKCGENGYVHASIPYGAYAFKKMGEVTGAYEAVITDDESYFEKDKLAEFDAVLCENTTQDHIADREKAQNLLDFIESGKGFVGIHAATDAFYNWQPYGAMIGGYFDGHPWGAGDTVTVKIDDPGHPLCEPFHGEDFSIKDEIYQFKPEPYSREKQRVLLSLNTDKTDMTKNGIKRTDGDFAVAWVKTFGSGRVFYCSLGHNISTYQRPAVMEHYLRGIQYAFGDLEADATPSAALSEAYFRDSAIRAQEAAIAGVIEGMKAWKYGDDPAVAEQLEKLAVRAQEDEPLRKALVAGMEEVLTSGAPKDAKWLVCKQLYMIGGIEAVDTLTQLLQKPETADMARYGLQQMGHPVALQAMLQVLPHATPDVKAGLLSSLGAAGDVGVIPVIRGELGSKDANVVAAAAAALGQIGGPDAAKALKAARRTANDKARMVITDAYIDVGYQLLDSGNVEDALAVFDELAREKSSGHVRLAGLIGYASTGGEETLTELAKRVVESEGEGQMLGVRAVAAVEGDAGTQLLAKLVKSDVSPEAKVVALTALEGRGAKGASAAVAEAAKSENPAVQAAAYRALSAVGGPEDVTLLASAAAGDGPGAQAARESLNRLSGKGVDNALVDALGESDAAVRVALIQSLKARGSEGALDAIAKQTKDESKAVRSAAYDAIADLGTADSLSMVLACVTADEEARGPAVSAAVALAKKNDAPAATEAVLASLKEAKNNAAVTASLYEVLSAIGSEGALNAVSGGLKSKDGAVKEAAVRALADWPNPAPAERLLKVAKQSDDGTLQAIAFRGALAQLAMPSDRTEAQTLNLYEKALDIAPTTDDKKAALSALANVHDKRVLEVVKPYLEKEEFKAEAKFVIESLENVKPEAKASDNTKAAADAIDGKLDTRWATGGPQKPGQWFLLDLGWEKTVTRLTLNTEASGGDFPREYAVYLHNTETEWGKPVAEGKGEGPVLELDVPDTSCRYVRIVQNGETGVNWWSIHELNVETN